MVVKKSRASDGDVFSTLGIGYLGQFLGQRINELVLEDCKRKGFAGMRVSHGYVIQHLVEDSARVARTGTELARRMGVTQQAASKAVSELARLGVVEVSRAADRRAKEIRLTAKGWKGVRYARSSRSRLEAKLTHRVGKQGYDEAREVLQACMRAVGGIERIRSRRVRQPT